MNESERLSVLGFECKRVGNLSSQLLSTSSFKL